VREETVPTKYDDFANSPTDSCRLYRVEHRDGQILVIPVSSEKKKSRKGGSRKNTSGLVIDGEFAKSSYFVGTVFLDTGTTVHIFRDRDLLSSTSSCREEVHGVGGERCEVTLRGKSRWGMPIMAPPVLSTSSHTGL
jgi:hypothetical protein